MLYTHILYIMLFIVEALDLRANVQSVTRLKIL